jgi:hypothetical protein
MTTTVKNSIPAPLALLEKDGTFWEVNQRALRGKRLIKAWVRCWYEFEIYWFLMFSAG